MADSPAATHHPASGDQPVRQRREARVVKPFCVAGDTGERLPFGLREAGDGDPTVVPLATISPMRGGGLVRRAIAVTTPLAAVG